jgi:hypothetical protein
MLTELPDKLSRTAGRATLQRPLAYWFIEFGRLSYLLDRHCRSFGEQSIESVYHMLDIRRWSFARVAVTSALWIALNVALAVGFVYLQFRKLSSTGSPGIGAVSFGIDELVFAALLLYLFGPAILVTVVWYFVRRS